MLHKSMISPLSLNAYLKIKQAAKLAGVHPDTLRRWERAGKLTVFRHPVNGYRLFVREDIERLLAEVCQ